MLPEICLLCHSPVDQDGLCNACHHDMPWLHANLCPRCALPSPGNQVCGQCLGTPPAFDACYAALHFEYPVIGIIHRFKYQADWRLGHTLASWLTRGINQQTPEDYRPDRIIPIPLHGSKLRERGFNQAQLLAEGWAKNQSVTLDYSVLQRITPTTSQASLDKAARLRNLEEAFLSKHDLSGQHVLIIDDVMTTGATMEQASLEIRRAGAARVDVACLARAWKK